MSEIQFDKYSKRGHDYHWGQVGHNILSRNTYVVSRYKIFTDLVGKEANGKNLLEVGCGDGVLSYMLAKLGSNVTGIDLSKEAIDVARDKCVNFINTKFINESAYNISLADNSFDYIVSTEVIEHLEHPERMLKEINRLWSGHCKIIISTPIRITEDPLDEMHCFEYFENEFRKVLENNFPGKNIEIIKSHPVFWMEFQNKRLFNKSIPRILLNLLSLFLRIDVHNGKNWRYYTLQTAVIS